MPTVLWETLRCCITLHCVVSLALIMSWPSMFLFGSAIPHANNPLKNVSSQFALFCKKAAPLHFIQASPQLMLSTLIGNFANKVAGFRRIVLHPIAKSHVKPWSVREHGTTWVRLFLPFFRTVEIDIKHQRKILTRFFRGGGGPWPLQPHSGCASVTTTKNHSQLWPSFLQRWPESIFRTPTPLLFQNFWIRVRIWQFFKFENPTPVHTPAAIINPTLIYPCFYLRNDHTDYCRHWKVTPDPGPKEKLRILPESTPVPGSGYTSGFLSWILFSDASSDVVESDRNLRDQDLVKISRRDWDFITPRLRPRLQNLCILPN